MFCFIRINNRDNSKAHAEGEYQTVKPYGYNGFTPRKPVNDIIAVSGVRHNFDLVRVFAQAFYRVCRG